MVRPSVSHPFPHPFHLNSLQSLVNSTTISAYLERQLDSVVPMVVIDVLSDESVRLNCAISIDFRHVHVIDEINQSLCSRGTVVTTQPRETTSDAIYAL